MKTDKLKDKFIDFAYMNKDFPDMTPEQCEKIYNWINSKYISKDKVEGFRGKHINGSTYKEIEFCAGYNLAVYEFNQKIEEVLK